MKKIIVIFLSISITLASNDELFEKLSKAAKFGQKLDLEIHGGHGLTYESVKYIASIPEMAELNIGHFLISEALFDGIEKTIYKMRQEIDNSQQSVGN